MLVTHMYGIKDSEKVRDDQNCHVNLVETKGESNIELKRHTLKSYRPLCSNPGLATLRSWPNYVTFLICNLLLKK